PATPLSAPSQTPSRSSNPHRKRWSPYERTRTSRERHPRRARIRRRPAQPRTRPRRPRRPDLQKTRRHPRQTDPAEPHPGRVRQRHRKRQEGTRRGAARGDGLLTACATFYVVHGGNDIGWRCEIPARELGARTEIIPEEDFVELVTQPHDTPPFRWHLRVDWPEGRTSTIKTALGWKRIYKDWPRADQISALFPDHEGTAVWIRPDPSRAQLARSMREQHGWRTISEVDDNYMMNPRLSFFLRSADWTPEKREYHLRSTMSMDA